MPASIADFDTIRELGNGGQGTVKLVKEKGSDPAKLFACKQIACTSQFILNNAVSEIKVLLKLNHPHIIRYEDFFITIEEPSPTTNDPNNTRLSSYSIADWTQQNQQQQQKQTASPTSSSFTAVVYLLTEYCECGDLSQLIRRTKNEFMEQGRHNVPEAKVLEWIEHCCDALDAIHKLGFMHQDMKTSNCFLTRDGAMKLGDFGLAAPIDNGSNSSNGNNVGTPAYLAPEQLQRHTQPKSEQQQQQQPPVTPAIDVWGLGSTLLELLTLQDRSINVQVLRDPVPALEKVVTDITQLRFSKPLALLVRDMLQRRPEDRPKPAEIIQRVGQIRNGAISSSSSRNSPLLSRGPSPVIVPSVPPQPSSSRVTPSSNTTAPAALYSSGTTTTTKCSICNVYDASIVCPACNDQPLCRSCDAMKHKSTERQSHVRTPAVVQHSARNSNNSARGGGGGGGGNCCESCPSSVGSSFDGGVPQLVPPAPTASIDFDYCTAPMTTSSGRGLTLGRSVTPVDPNAPQSRLLNNNNNGVKPLAPLAKPKPVFSGAMTSARGSNSNNALASSSSLTSNPVTPTNALSGSFCRNPTSGRANNNNNQQPASKAMSNVPAFPSRPEQPNQQQQQQQRPLSPFNGRVSPSLLGSAGAGAGATDAAALDAGARSSSTTRFSPMVLAGPPRPELHVPSPQFPTIAAALQKAESGTRIVVNGSGVYSEPLDFVRPDVEIVGNPSSVALQSSSSSSAASSASNNNRKPTIEVRGAAVGAAVRIGDVSRIKLCNLSIVHAGGTTTSPLPPPQASSAAVDAASSEQKQFAILIADAAGVVVENCDVTSESGSGIGVAGAQSDPLISGCTITAHLNGVHISAGATGTVCRNVIRGTSLAAILVKRKAQPRLLSNTLENNRQAGIFFFRAGGLTEKNTIVNCGGCAIVIKGGSNPTVRRNRIQQCAQAGILISDESRGTVSENVIQQTRKTGILIKTGASPVVVRNHISRGLEAGIYVFENGGGRIEDNEVVDNANAGIIVTTGGNPVVVGNRVLRNTYEGIWVCNEGSGRFEKNVLEGNGRRGAVDIQSGCRVEWIA